MTHLLIWKHSLYDLRSTEVFIRELKVASQKSCYFPVSNSSIDFPRNICISLRRYGRFTEHVGFFSSVWLAHCQLWTIVKGATSPTQCKSLRLIFRLRSHWDFVTRLRPYARPSNSGVWFSNLLILMKRLVATANRTY